MKALVWQRWNELPPCWVCGGRAPYVHEGRYYCVRNDCQCVAAGLCTADAARARLHARGITTNPPPLEAA